METIEFSLIGAEDIKFGYQTFPVTLADASVEQFSELDISFLLPSYPQSQLPQAREGSIVRASDGNQGLWQFVNGAWVPLNAERANAWEFGFYPGHDPASNAAAWAAMIASVASGTIIDVPPGTYHYDGSLLLNKAITVQGAGPQATVLLPMTPNQPGISIAIGGVTLRDLTLTRTIQPIAGGDGIVTGNAPLADILLEHLFVDKHYRGVQLCPSPLSRMERCVVQRCESNGVACDYGTDGAVRWVVNHVVSQHHLGNGFACNNTSAVTGSGPFLLDCRTTNNALSGYAVLGQSGNALHSVFLMRCVSDGDSGHGVRLENTFGELHMISNCHIGRVGMLGGVPRGFAGTLGVATNAGNGLRILGNVSNGGINVVGGLIWGCADSGVLLQTPNVAVVGLTLLGNGAALNSDLEKRAGVSIKANACSVNACRFFNVVSNPGQVRGVILGAEVTNSADIDCSNYFSGYTNSLQGVDTTLAATVLVTSVFTMGPIVNTGRYPLILADELAGPNAFKHLRVVSGALEIRNNANNATLLQITDSGTVFCAATTGAFAPNILTTAQRDALTPSNGMLIYNSTLGVFQGRAAGAWVNL